MDNKALLNARKTLVDQISKEMLGPGSEFSIPDDDNEIISDFPEVRYSVGILFPQDIAIGVENNDSAPLESPVGEVENLEEEVTDQDDKQEIAEEQSAYGRSIAEDTDISTFDEEISLSTQNLPSSVGYTFFVDSHFINFTFNISFGTYRKLNLNDCTIPFTPESASYSIPEQLGELAEFDCAKKVLRLKQKLKRKDVHYYFNTFKIDDHLLKDALLRLCDQVNRGFKRIPHNVEEKIEFAEKDYVTISKIDDCSLKLTALRRVVSCKVTAVTVMLVNTATGRYDGTNSIFQPRISISSEDNGFRFIEYSRMTTYDSLDEEDKTLALLYRDKRIFATGHGTAAEWDINESGNGVIWNEFMPTYEVPQIDFNLPDKNVNSDCLSMYFLSDLDSTSKQDKLLAISSLVDSYQTWIGTLQEEAKNLDGTYIDCANKHIRECKEASKRMINGLSVLHNDEHAYNAFLLANRAMIMQRIHTEIQAKDKLPNDYGLQSFMSGLDYSNPKTYPGTQAHNWRPFQLAFLLLSIQSIVNPGCDERDLVDLIWFPTGGGKTEAYLGLTAFTIFYRRLTTLDSSGGTAVIMRYTLRLLAAQQFVRAGTLICACESIRRDSYESSRYPAYPLGKEEITIGLWIGGQHTPNRNEEAKYCWKELNDADAGELGYAKDKFNKFQIIKCPWCGTKLVKEAEGKSLAGQWGYMFKGRRFYMACPQEECEFEDRLPIQVVDEELYLSPPSLLFGTVDKFAMLPWKKEIGAFFGVGSNVMAPELVIQDELHLISGPLGTVVGLYETAIDALCSHKGINPKIIASTATIRRAKSQCSALYNRDVRQFPPFGLDAQDSYFAREASLKNKPGRLYMGIQPAGKTKAMMQARMMAAILQRVYMMDYPDEIKDKYWTLALYFNSLRDLGKCSTLVDDDVKDFIRRMASRFGSRKDLRQIGYASELTSRISTSQLNETLEKLENLNYSKENLDKKRYPINVLLATNMISVGVDVARLNVMLIVGQPKLTSEYIQASSRIGRSYPGIAFTLYDASKSRDRSHYEQFRAYHESFYKFVEPTGVTPFSKPARERGLHAVLISLIRHLHGLSADTDAAHFDMDSDYLKAAKDYIINRVNDINSRSELQVNDETSDIENEINDFCQEWMERARLAEENSFRYGDKYIVKPPEGHAKRLIKSYGNSQGDPSRETLTSMRNVDKNVATNILIWE